MKQTRAADVHETLKATTAAHKVARRVRELATSARERAETAEGAAYEVERDAERAYEASREAMAKAYPSSARK